MEEVIKKYDRSDEMAKYKEEYLADNALNFGFESLASKDDALLKIIESYDNLSNDDIERLAVKTLNPNRLRSMLLRYELKYGTADSCKMSLEDFKAEACAILDKYHWKAGGFQFEDKVWGIHSYVSEEFSVKENELLFVNTISLCEASNDETVEYINLLTDRFNMIADNVNVQVDFKQSLRNNIIFVLIWAIDEELEEENPDIGL